MQGLDMRFYGEVRKIMLEISSKEVYLHSVSWVKDKKEIGQRFNVYFLNTGDLPAV